MSMLGQTFAYYYLADVNFEKDKSILGDLQEGMIKRPPGAEVNPSYKLSQSSKDGSEALDKVL